MTNPHKLSECTEMSEEKFQECLKRVDMKVFIENPTQALTDAGVTLKQGVTFKFAETEKTVPDNVFQLILSQKNNEKLSMENLDKVAGGGTRDEYLISQGCEKNKQGKWEKMQYNTATGKTELFVLCIPEND